MYSRILALRDNSASLCQSGLGLRDFTLPQQAAGKRNRAFHFVVTHFFLAENFQGIAYRLFGCRSASLFEIKLRQREVKLGRLSLCADFLPNTNRFYQTPASSLQLTLCDKYSAGAVKIFRMTGDIRASLQLNRSLGLLHCLGKVAALQSQL